MYKVNLYMKSGNTITFLSEKLNYKTSLNGDYTEVVWENSQNSPYPGLQSVNPLQIEAITYNELSEEDLND